MVNGAVEEKDAMSGKCKEKKSRKRDVEISMDGLVA